MSAPHRSPSAARATYLREPSRGEFAARLEALHLAGGNPSLRTLAAAARRRAQTIRGCERSVSTSVTAQRISDWKRGSNVPARFETVLPVLLVLIDSARRRGQITRVELVNLPQWRQLWAQAKAMRRNRIPTGAGCPFPGMAPYGRADAPGFTGREAALTQLLALVKDSAAAVSSERVLALTGPTGVGKTSLLQAGLIPKLAATRLRWGVHTVVLGSDQSHTAALDIAEFHGAGPHLVIIDQFERFFAAERAARDSLVAAIERLAEHAVVLLSMRTGHLTACADHPTLLDAVKRRGCLLEAMRSDELRTVVRQSTHRRGLSLEPGLDDVLLTAIEGARRLGREPGELSILSQTLREMWPHRTGARLTVESYRQVGGVSGVVHAAAEATWSRLTVPQQRVAQRLLLDLVLVRGDADDTRRRVPYDELCRSAGNAPGGPAVLDALIAARLITIDGDAGYISHDLLLVWRRLADWLDQQR